MRRTTTIKKNNKLRTLGLFVLALGLSVVDAAPVSASGVTTGTAFIQQRASKKRSQQRAKPSRKSNEKANVRKSAKVNRQKSQRASSSRSVKRSENKSRNTSSRTQNRSRVEKSRTQSRTNRSRSVPDDKKRSNNRGRTVENRSRTRTKSTTTTSRTRTRAKTNTKQRSNRNGNSGRVNRDDDRNRRNGNNGRVNSDDRNRRIGNNGRVNRDDRNRRNGNNGRVNSRVDRRNWSRIERNTRRTRLDGYGRKGRVHRDLGKRYKNKRGGWSFNIWLNSRTRRHFGNRNYYRYHPYYGRYDKYSYYRRNYYRRGRAALGFYIHIPFFKSHYRSGYTRRFVYRQRFKSNSHYNGRSYGVELNVHTQLKKKVRNISRDRVKIEFEIERISLFDGNVFLGDVDRIPGNLDEIEAVVHPDGYVEFDKMVHLIGDLDSGFELISTRHYNGSLLSSYENGHRMDVGELDLRDGRVHKVRNSRLFNPYDGYNGLVPISLLPDDEQYGFQYLAGGHDYDHDYYRGNYDYYSNDRYDDNGYSHRNTDAYNSIRPSVGVRGIFNNKAATSYETKNGIRIEEDREVEIEMLDGNNSNVYRK